MFAPGVESRAILISALSLGAVLSLASPGSAQRLVPGSVAPALDQCAWIHGPPVQIGQVPGRVVALEFRDLDSPDRWSHLSALTNLQRRFRDKVQIAALCDDRAAIDRAVAEFSIVRFFTGTRSPRTHPKTHGCRA